LAMIVSLNSFSMEKTKITPIWKVTFTKDIEHTPNTWLSATVPGAVQLDYAKSRNWPPYYYAESWKEYLWIEDVYWFYKTDFRKPELRNGEQLFFISKGIDYEFEIWLNNEKLFYQEGMFSPVEINLTQLLRNENELLIKL